jgi:stage III sporulation protein AD
MTEYLRFAAAALVGLILTLVVGRQSKDLSLLLSLAVCVLLCLGALEFLEPVTEFLAQLRKLGDLDGEAVSILLKCAGIGMLSDLAGLLCADAGEGAMGKALQLCSNAAILWLSLPLFRQVLTMIGEVLAKL